MVQAGCSAYLRTINTLPIAFLLSCSSGQVAVTNIHNALPLLLLLLWVDACYVLLLHATSYCCCCCH
jgi:hypothetical protein